MKSPGTHSDTRVFFAKVATLLFATVASLAHAGGPMGVDVGWVINNNGSPILTSSMCSSLVAGKTGYIRVEFRLVGTNTTWNSTMLGYYDAVINNAVAAGLEVIGLIDYSSWPGNQAQWTSNSWECSGGNGDNNYINGYAANAVVPLVSHFYNRIKVYELWNEPNACTTCSSCGTEGGSFIYPSNFSQLLANAYADLEYAGLKNYVTIVSGGVFGHSISGYSYGNAGAQYIDDTYNVGINSVGSFSYTKSHWGTYPLDAIGQHIYIDQGTTTTSGEFQQYITWVQQAYQKYEGTGTSKKSVITEFGWTTASVSTNTQNQNLNTAFGVIEGDYKSVSHAIWFNWQDGGAGDYGVLYGSGAPKLSYASYQYQEQYEGYYINGTLDNNILNYFNSHGQAQIGDAYDNGGTAWVHSWSGSGYSANVQDFQGGTNGTLDMQDSSFGTFQINDVHGLWDYYLAHGGISHYGAAKNDEYGYSGGTRQDFQAHYLTWTSGGGIVEH
jgi:hypothetical protein